MMRSFLNIETSQITLNQCRIEKYQNINKTSPIQTIWVPVIGGEKKVN